MSGHVVIVGAGHAGGTLAALLRQYKYPDPVTLIGAEPWAPYQRPPLSKALLKGETGVEGLTLRPSSFYAGNGIDWRPECRALRVDARARTLQTSRGDELTYDTLVLATGLNALALPALTEAGAGVHTLRTANDAIALRADLQRGERLVLIGAGFIGLEVAAAARSLGCEVTVVERLPHLLMRAASPPVAQFLRDYHEARGVSFRLDATVQRLAMRDGRVASVELQDGTSLACDTVLVGIGGRPDLSLAAQAGLQTDAGILVDASGRTSNPSIFAIGDVAQRPVPTLSRRVRLESVQNAVEQARWVACALTGRAVPSAEVPWNWSDQFDLKLQFAGRWDDGSDLHIRGDACSAGFAVFHTREGVLIGIEAVNAPREFMAARQLIASARPIDPARLVDPAVEPRGFAA